MNWRATLRNLQTEGKGTKKTVINLKSIIEGFSSSLDKTETGISSLEDSAIEITHIKHQKGKIIFKWR